MSNKSSLYEAFEVLQIIYHTFTKKIKTNVNRNERLIHCIVQYHKTLEHSKRTVFLVAFVPQSENNIENAKRYENNAWVTSFENLRCVILFYLEKKEWS